MKIPTEKSRIDPANYQLLEAQFERQRLIEAIREGERAIEEGRVRPAERALQEMKAKYDF